jgi:DNA-binding transcriptional ArsR family regulator
MSEAASRVECIREAARAAALLHPLRTSILAALREPDSAAGLARRLALPRQKVNYHLRELERHGFLEQVEERRRGNCTERIVRAVAHHYLISPAALGGLAADPAAIADRASSAYLVALAARAMREVATLREDAHAAGKKLPTFALETEVRFRSSDEQHAFAEELSRAVAALVARYHDESAPGGRPFRWFVGSYPTPKANQENDDGRRHEDA